MQPSSVSRTKRVACSLPPWAPLGYMLTCLAFALLRARCRTLRRLHRLCSGVEAGPSGRSWESAAALSRLLPTMLQSDPFPPLAAWFAASMAGSNQLQQKALACILPHLGIHFRSVHLLCPAHVQHCTVCSVPLPVVTHASRL